MEIKEALKIANKLVVVMVEFGWDSVFITPNPLLKEELQVSVGAHRYVAEDLDFLLKIAKKHNKYLAIEDNVATYEEFEDEEPEKTSDKTE